MAGRCGRARLAVNRLHHPVQVRRRVLDVQVLVLARPALRREHRTAVDLVEVAVWKLVMALRIRGRRVVDSQVPSAELGRPVLLDELVLLLGGRLMLAPRITLIRHELAVVDQGPGVVESSLVQLDAHRRFLRPRGFEGMILRIRTQSRYVPGDGHREISWLSTFTRRWSWWARPPPAWRTRSAVRSRGLGGPSGTCAGSRWWRPAARSRTTGWHTGR